MPQLTVLEGSTFCICDELGNISQVTHGLFAEDMRFLSRLSATLNGKPPLLLSSGTVEYFSAAFFLRNAPSEGLPSDSIVIERDRFVGEGMQDHLVLTNVSMQSLTFRLDLAFETDFADIISVKEWDFSLGDPIHAKPLPAPVEALFDEENDHFMLVDREGGARTQVLLSRRGTPKVGGASFEVTLEPAGRWDVRIHVIPLPASAAEHLPNFVERRFGEERRRVRESLAIWKLTVPQLVASPDGFSDTFSRSVADLASLRMRGSSGGISRLPAAGMPWFMTVFGRDTLITCLQTMIFGPELARGALHELAHLQATTDDPSRDAEPGKIVHEMRRGKCADRWFDRYYGTVDATPLFLILLSEAWRWTDDTALVTELESSARAALDWIDRYGDRDGDGFVEYERRTERGLQNQSWKDSGDSQRFHDGRYATTPVAPCEVQGYVYDAKLRMAEIAHTVWQDEALGRRLEQEARTLRERFDAAYWLPERGYHALALDGEKQPVDSLCSNIGHLLWSGIALPERVDEVSEHLLSPALFSGWGIRTMSTADAAFNPLSYHNGTVWPHDNSLCAWGLAKAGHWESAHRIARALIDAAGYFAHQLPEVFAGLDRGATPFPVAYPTAARPQAWAAGTPVLLLRLLLGLEPNRERRRLESIVPVDDAAAFTPIDLRGIRAFGQAWNVALTDGGLTVDCVDDERGAA
jgi:glycogen debranching enzyme